MTVSTPNNLNVVVLHLCLVSWLLGHIVKWQVKAIVFLKSAHGCHPRSEAYCTTKRKKKILTKPRGEKRLPECLDFTTEVTGPPSPK